jgi:hypothetical protein
MENDKQNIWSYSYSFNQPLNNNWVSKLDEAELEMLFLSVMSDDLELTECSEARNMLENIGIKC